jgi:hydrogenase maturation protein HypF
LETPCLPDTWTVIIGGHVQGVGFRPFVYRIAVRLGLKGWVRNLAGRVEIVAQTDLQTLERFTEQLLRWAPPLAKPVLIETRSGRGEALTDFRIAASEVADEADIHVPPDYFACPDCQAELRDPADRRYRYPFINCTQCGPRYTLIDRLPYDRPNTSMAGFSLCAACWAEYNDPLDRRFHAEPVACPECGPWLSFVAGSQRVEGNEAALAAVIARLRDGAIIAVRGIGGYHLVCDAANEQAVICLRERKRRPHKPLAVMVPEAGEDGCEAIRDVSNAQAVELALIRDPQRPIVRCPKAASDSLAASIAPELDEVGLFLPYSPLHHLLLDDFGAPLVATSGNLSGEPVLTDPQQAETRLGHIADGFLHHNRPIRRPADDAVFRVIAGRPRPIRLGRGVAPLEVRLPQPVRWPLLAVGGHIKNTVALAWGARAVISPHIGDLDSPRSLEVFEQVIADLQRLYHVRVEAIACDAHPGYASSRWARAQGLKIIEVFHHHAHAAAVAGEFNVAGNLLVFTWDGTGYGADGTIWGGEGLLGHPGGWQRFSTLRPLRLPGGDRAGREPWRAAAAVCWETGTEPPQLPSGVALARQAWERQFNCPLSSAVGRLFDAAAALSGLCQNATFEGQGPMLLEAAAGSWQPEPPLPIAHDADGCWRADWAPLMAMLGDMGLSVKERAARFHGALAHTMVSLAELARAEYAIETVGLSGGVFQNRLLSEAAVRLLSEHGFEVLLPERIPCNDAGISYGQLVEASATATSASDTA